METGKVFLDQVTVGARMRALDERKVESLADSIAKIGLQHPIHVWAPDDKSVHLVAGLHRFTAAQRLGLDEIDCVFVNLDEIDRRRWEIAENLHRSELTVQERADHIAEWVRLTDEKVLAQVEPKPKNGRPEGGVRAAAREIGVDRNKAQRAVKIAGIAPEAKEAAKQAGLDDNQSALLKVARERTPAAQVAKVQQIVAPEPLDDWEATEKQLAALMNAWNRASADARRLFLERVDTPVFDNTSKGAKLYEEWVGGK